MKNFIQLFTTASLILLIFSGLTKPAFTADLSPYEILKKSDQARGNIDGISWNVTITATEKNKTNTRKIRVISRGFDIVANTLKPARRRGHMLIMLKGNMWFYKPGLSKPVPISKRQKLLGLATNGDIASTNYAENYDILKQKNEVIDNEECISFDLQAKTTNATYRRIRYWVSRQRMVGIKADFFSTNGEKLLKSARMEYNNRVDSATAKERLFISRMTIYDKLMSNGKTVMDFSSPHFRKLSPSLFNINLLGN